MKKLLALFFCLFSLGAFSQVGINTTSPNVLSELDITNTVSGTDTVPKGIMIPRITTIQRDGINLLNDTKTGGEGLMIFNITTNCFNFYNKSKQKWEDLCGGDSKAKIDPPPCSSQSIYGRYFRGTTVSGAANYLTLQVNVVTPGTFSVLGLPDNKDSYAFSTSGNFIAAGLNTITVPCSGTPQIAGPTTISININGSVIAACPTLVVSVENFTPSYTTTGCGTAGTGNNGSITVNGNYSVGVPTNGTNFINVTIQVPSSDVGAAYNIATLAPTNGLTFKGTGTFGPISGPQNVNLYASGTPIATDDGKMNNTANSALYTLSSNSITNPLPCKFGVPVAGAPNYTYACGTPTVAGTYVVGIPLDPTKNYISMNVTNTAVDYGKPCNITTTTVNGMTFSGSGTLSATGTTTILLRGSGTPTATAEGTSNFDISSWNSTATPPSGCPIAVVGKAVRYTLNSLDSIPGTVWNQTTSTVSGTGYSFTKYNGGYLNACVVGTPLVPNKNAIKVNITVPAGSNGLKTVISTDVQNGISFKSDTITLVTGTMSVRLKGSGTPAAAGAYNYTASCNNNVNATNNTIPVAIASMYKTINIFINGTYDNGDPQLSNISSGQNTAYAIPNTLNGNAYFISDPHNFGPLASGANGIYQNGFSTTRYVNATGALLSNYLTDQKPDIVLLSYGYIPISGDGATIRTYLQKGGIVLTISQETPANATLLNGVFNTGSAITTGFAPNGYSVWKFESTITGDPIINGPYSDLAATAGYWGEDRSSTVLVTAGLPANTLVYSNGNDVSNNQTTAGAVSSFRATDMDFFYFGDGGFLATDGATNAVVGNYQYKSVGTTYAPASYSTVSGALAPVLHTGYGNNIKFSVSNSFVFANFMYWATNRVRTQGYPARQ